MQDSRLSGNPALASGATSAPRARHSAVGLRHCVLALAVVLLALAVAVSGTQGGRTAVRTLLFLPAMFPNSPVRPLALISGTPSCEEITLRYADLEAPADVCSPASEGRHGALVLSLGVHPLDRHDPFLEQVTDALVRTDLVVLRPASPDLTAGLITPREIDGLVSAFQALQARPEVDPSRVGLAGFSVGGALSTVAAADPRIRDNVRLVYSFGAYYDARDVLGAIADGRVSAEGRDQTWTPHPWSVHVFVEQIVAALPADAERDYLAAVLADPETAGPPKFPLSPLGQMLYDLLNGEQVDGTALLAALPPAARDTFYRLSPVAAVRELRAPLYVMHDVGDTLIPYTESRRLAESAPPGVLRRYDEFHMFQHVTPREPAEVLGSLGDLAALSKHLDAVFLALAE